MAELPGEAFSHAKKYNLVSGLEDIYISERTEQIGVTWQNGLVWDKKLIEKFYSILKDRNDFFVVLDIGAQTGCFTLLAKYFPNSMWYAFEPINEAVDELKVNLALNDIKNVSVYPVCISNYPKEDYLKVPKDINVVCGNAEWGLATLGEKIVRFKEYEIRKVKCITLDQFIESEHVKKVDFIKIDTEGWELFVLEGGKTLISQSRPIILMEFNQKNLYQCSVTEHDIYQFLKEFDYEWEFVSPEDILCRPI